MTNHRFPPILSIFPAIVLFIFCTSPLHGAQLVDRVVAIVNDDIITMSDVNDAGKEYFMKITEQAPPAQMEDALSRARVEVLNNLIDKELIAQEAIKQNVSVSDEELQRAAEQMLIKNNMTRDMLDAQLGQMGMNYDTYLESMRSQILQSKLVNYEIRSKIIITDDMILDYYDTHYTKHMSGGGYYLLQMGFTWDKPDEESAPAGDKEKMDARKRAERVHALALGGQDFRTLAQKFSDLPSAADGGDLGVFQKDDMAPYMQDAVVHLNTGEISDIIETPSGYQFFKLLSGQDGQIVVQAPLSSVKEEIRDKLYQQILKEDYEEWITKIKKDAFIKKL